MAAAPRRRRTPHAGRRRAPGRGPRTRPRQRRRASSRSRSAVEERLAVERRVGVVDEVPGPVVDVEQHHVVRRGRGLGDRGRDVGDDDPGPVVGQQLRAVGDGAVAHPLDQRRLDLDDVAPLDAPVAEHPVEGEAETEPADEHPPRLARRSAERGVGQRPLGGVLGGVHHEHPLARSSSTVGPPVSGAARAAPARRAPTRSARPRRTPSVTVGDPPSGGEELVRGIKVE